MPEDNIKSAQEAFKYDPSKEDKKTIGFVYDEFDEMLAERERELPEFNNRTLKQFLDDSHKRVNAYAPSKDSQDKEEWQSNVTLPTVRDQLKRVIAGFSLQVPDLNVRAFGEGYRTQVKKGEITKEVVKGSYLENDNPVLDNFWESWQAAVDGTVITYEGYLKTSYKQKFIKSYDITTGEIETDERDVNVDDKCVSITLPLTEIYIKDCSVQDIQEQPAVAWVKYLDQQDFKKEFGKYENSDIVPYVSREKDVDTDTFYKKDRWHDRLGGKEKIEVIRYYNQFLDRYVIVANGILLLDAPLLWKVNGVKRYPFAKSIFEPFHNKNSFYGNSLPNILQGYFDSYLTLWNSVMDKEYRSLEKPLLVGSVNRDALELEDEFVGSDTKIYVDDVSQVTPMDIGEVNNADISMLELVAAGLQETAPTMSQLLGENDATAREIVIAEEKMRELKSINSEFISDLWRQKYQLRLANIQLNWPKPRKVYDEQGGETKKIYKTYIIENATLDNDGTKGTLAVQFRDDLTPEKRAKLRREASAEAEFMKKQGETYKKLYLPDDYLDSSEFRIKVISETLHKTSLAKMQATVLEKLETIAELFPQIFIANQEEYFTDVAEAYEEDPEDALQNFRELQESMEEAQKGETQAREQVREQEGAEEALSEIR